MDIREKTMVTQSAMRRSWRVWEGKGGWQKDKCVVSLSRTVYKSLEVWMISLSLGPESAAQGAAETDILGLNFKLTIHPSLRVALLPFPYQ